MNLTKERNPVSDKSCQLIEQTRRKSKSKEDEQRVGRKLEKTDGSILDAKQ